MNEIRTPAQVYAVVIGALLVVVGILGFFADAGFGNLGTDVEGDDFIIFEVNGWHNVVHIVSGVAGLALMGTAMGARAFALGFGAIYGVVTIWGFIDGNSVLWLIPVDLADNFLHLAISVAGIAAGLVSTSEPSPRAPGAPTTG